MPRVFAALILLNLLSAVAGCEKKPMNYFARTAPEPEVTAMAGVPQRFIATRHTLEITTSEQNIPKAWESVITFCGTLRCEALSSSITTKTSGSMPSGTISLRTAPEDLKSLLAYVATQGTIVQHTTENEDKTAAVVDAEARLKNLTSFRDSLRAMQAKPSVAVKDLVEIQKHLTDVQSQLTARQPSGKSWRTKRRKLP